MLSGSSFNFASTTNCNGATLPVFVQEGVSYTAPELRVVANTTVMLNLSYPTGTSNLDVIPFGLLLSNMTHGVASGDALGLTVSDLSVAAQSCLVPPYASRGATDNNNTVSHSFTVGSNGISWSPVPCTITWKVPPLSNQTQIYYFIAADNTPSAPRRIYIVNSTDSPSSTTGIPTTPVPTTGTPTTPSPILSSSSSSSSSTSFSFSSSNSTSFSTTGSSGSRSSSTSSTGSSGTAPIGTSSSSSSISNPNGANTGHVSLAVAVAVMFGSWLTV